MIHISQKNTFQTMEMAIKRFDEKFQLCFFYMIQTFIINDNNNDFLKKDLKHELIGYNFLKIFEDKITKPILLLYQQKDFLLMTMNIIILYQILQKKILKFKVVK